MVLVPPEALTGAEHDGEAIDRPGGGSIAWKPPITHAGLLSSVKAVACSFIVPAVHVAT